ncbi:MAG: hypothetical protein ACI86H_002469, partial [bacterium]
MYAIPKTKQLRDSCLTVFHNRVKKVENTFRESG